ncbi:MAG: HAMP domain-containing protein [Bacteroidetes bacterium]|nr:MAG: HAMP domain-containing protein [Bacteroidota bacterium]
MKKFTLRIWWTLFSSMLFIALMGSISEFEANTDRTDEYGKRIARQLDISKSQFDRIWENDTLLALIRAGIFREDVLNALRHNRSMALVEEDGQLRYWSSLAVDSDIQPYFDSSGTGIAHIKRGIHFYEVKTLNNQQIMLLYPLYRTYQVSKNPLLVEGFNRDLNINSQALFGFEPKSGYIQISSNLTPNPIFVHFAEPYANETSWYVYLALLIGLVLFSAFLLQLFDVLESRFGYFKAWVSVSGIIVLIRVLSFVFDYPFFIYSHEFFTTDVYSGSSFIPSIGDLFLDTVLLFLIAFSAFKGVNSHVRGTRTKTLTKREAIGYTGLLVFVSYVFTLVCLGQIHSLIQDSTLNFDVTTILESGGYTLIGLTIAAMFLTAQFLLVNMVVLLSGTYQISNWRLLSFFVVSILVSLPVCYALGWLDWVLQIQSVSYGIAIFITYQLVINQNSFQQSISVLFIVAIFASNLFYRSMHDKERNQRVEIANRVSSPKDPRAESVFLQVESQLEQDRFIIDYFRNSLLLKSQLEKRIKQLYFTGYLSRYDIDIYDYDPYGGHFKERNDYPFQFLDQVYNTKTQSTLSNHFYFINDPTLRYGYMARYEVRGPEGKLGYLFIVLKPKFVQDEKIFTELLAQTDDGKTDMSRYSYAIYQNNYLITQSGSFPYSLNNNFDDLDEVFTIQDNYSHYITKKEGQLMVVVSKERDSWLVPFSVFSFLFLIFTLFSALVFVLNIFFSYMRLASARFGIKRRQWASFSLRFRRMLPFRSYRGLFFSTRIQMVTIGLVLMAMVLTGYFTFEYIRFKYAERQFDRLDSKVKSVLGAIENENHFDQMMYYPDQLSAYLNQLAEYYNTDINFYDLNGTLRASTQMRIFQNGLLLNKIHPSAYAKIETESRSQHFQEERIGQLFFLAAYVPVFDSQHQLLGYLNIPFFSNERELELELSDFLESFINIYVFLFLLAGVVAYIISQRITRPLTYIQRKLSETRLGGVNERLEWRQNDEIGQLVRQYNSMLSKLEESADLLAKGEREGAWKEMAKQIAHEIKNPLTPMKLSVQHLQRAWADRRDNIDDTFRRVTGVLIDQIDSLSLLATEFSSFAKMPTAKKEEFELTSVINSVVELYFNTENLTLTYSSGNEQLTVMADKDQLSRVFNNIVKNAIQSIPDDRAGQISVDINRNGNWAEVCITDNGSGIPEEIASKIFSPSFSTKNSGMGLGLAISKQIIESCEGQIFFETKEGQGTRFTVRVPLLKD